MCAVSELFDRIVDKNLLVRRMYVVANHVLPEADVPKKNDEMCIRDRDKIPKIIVPEDKKNYEYLLERCDAFVKQHRGYIKGIVDYHLSLIHILSRQ